MLLVNKKYPIIILSILILFLSAISPVWADSTTQGFNLWPMITTDNKDKVWSIKFTTPLDTATINNNSIFVQDDNNQKLTSKISYSADRTVATVTPSTPYVPGKIYHIFITKALTDPKGISINQEVSVPFVFIDPSEAINLIDDQFSVLITNLTVVANSSVHTAKVNGLIMHYEGNCVFSLGVINLKRGDSTTVQVYDQNNKLLDTQKYIID